MILATKVLEGTDDLSKRLTLQSPVVEVIFIILATQDLTGTHDLSERLTLMSPVVEVIFIILATRISQEHMIYQRG